MAIRQERPGGPSTEPIRSLIRHDWIDSGGPDSIRRLSLFSAWPGCSMAWKSSSPATSRSQRNLFHLRLGPHQGLRRLEQRYGVLLHVLCAGQSHRPAYDRPSVRPHRATTHDLGHLHPLRHPPDHQRNSVQGRSTQRNDPDHLLARRRALGSSRHFSSPTSSLKPTLQVALARFNFFVVTRGGRGSGLVA